MTNKSIDPLYVSALDILTGALGVFIVLNFLNTRTPPAPQPVAKAETKAEKPARPATAKRQTPAPIPRRYNPAPATPAPNPAPKPATPAPVASTPPKSPAPATEPAPEQPAPAPPQDPVAVDLMKQTKGAVALLLQQDGKAKQSVEFMLRQGSKTWRPGRASKYQNNEFKYEKALSYFYQEEAQPGVYEVWVRVKRNSRNAGAQPFALFGKVIPPGQKAQTKAFGTFATGSEEWVNAGTFTVTAGSVSFKPALPPAAAVKPGEEPASGKQPELPKAKPKKAGKWG